MFTHTYTGAASNTPNHQTVLHYVVTNLAHAVCMFPPRTVVSIVCTQRVAVVNTVIAFAWAPYYPRLSDDAVLQIRFVVIELPRSRSAL